MTIGEEALGRVLDNEYRRLRAEAAERLHNAFVDVVAEQTPSVETVLYVLEMLRLSVLQRQGRAVADKPAQVLPPKPADEAQPELTGWRAEREKRAKEKSAEKD